MLLLVSGCGAPATPPGAQQANGPQLGSSSPGVRPPEPPLTAPVAALPQPAAAGNQMGRQVMSLAKEILDARSNPFMNKLPIPDLIAADPAAGGEPSPADQTFQSVMLSGVVKRGTHWMALLKLGDRGTEMVKEGDVLSVEGQMMRITQIRENAVNVMPLGAEKDPDQGAAKTRTLFLPDIIGFGGGSGSPVPSRMPSHSPAGSETAPSSGKGLSDIFKGLTENLSDKSSEILNGLQEPN